MAKHEEYSDYDSRSDSELEFGTEYMTEDSHGDSDGSLSEDSRSSSIK
jgi:hypothetical protein